MADAGVNGHGPEEEGVAEPAPARLSDEYVTEGLKNITRALLRQRVRENLETVVVAASAFAMGVAAEFDDPEKVARTRAAIDHIALAVDLTVDWPVDEQGRPAALKVPE